MERQLATIQQIAKLTPIPGADQIEVAHVLGWTVVVKKGDFQPMDLCVFCEIDSLLPERAEFEFLRKSCWVDNGLVRGFRIKTIRLRKQLSQGIVFNTSILEKEVDDTSLSVEQQTILQDLANSASKHFETAATANVVYMPPISIGEDVTTYLGIVKYEKPMPANMSGKTIGSFPTHIIPKTDEIRIQTVPHVLSLHKNKPFYVTEKLDGTSATFYRTKEVTGVIYHERDGDYVPENTVMRPERLGICSRNLELAMDEQSTVYHTVYKTHNIDSKLKNWDYDVAIQGEIVGPGIQKNKYKLDQIKLFVFNIYDIEKKRFLDFHSMKAVCEFLNLDTVPVIDIGFELPDTIEELLAYAEDTSCICNNTPREGIVVRPLIEANDPVLGRLSFKVISNSYLEKEED